MGHQTLNLPAVLEGRDVWITAYAAWYHHFLAMQPQDHLAGPWARDMTEASLMNFHLRDDQTEIRQAAMQTPAPAPAFASAPAPAPKPVSVVAAPRKNEEQLSLLP